MAVDAQIDKLRIDIETNITSDAKRIDEIYESLTHLKNITEQQWSGLDEIANRINKLGAINQVSFSQFNSNLQSITSNLSPLQQAFQIQARELESQLSTAVLNYNKRLEELNKNTTNLGNSSGATDESLMYFEQTIRKLTAQTIAYNNQVNKLSTQKIDTSEQTLAFNAQINALREVITQYDTLARTLGVLSPEATQMAVQIKLGNQELKQFGEQLLALDPSQTEKINNTFFKYNEVLRKIGVSQQLVYEKQQQLFEQQQAENRIAEVNSKFNAQIIAIKNLVAEYDTYSKTLGILNPQTLETVNYLTNANERLKELGTQLTQIDPTQTEKVANVTYRYDEVLRKINVSQTVAKNRSDELAKAIDTSGNSAKKASGFFGQLAESVRRITFYRVVRRAIQLIGKELVGAINNFAQYDEQTNRAISNIQSSWKAFSNSLGIVISQLIVAVQPLLTSILDTATNIANAISLIFAKLAGEEYYSKAIKYETDYAEQIEKTNKQLLSFDRFNVLQQQQAVSPMEMFETELVSTGIENASEQTLYFMKILEQLSGLFNKIIDIVKKLWETIEPHLPGLIDSLTKIADGLSNVMDDLSPVVDKVIDFVVEAIDFIDKAGLMEEAIWAIGIALIFAKTGFIGLGVAAGLLIGDALTKLPKEARLVAGAFLVLMGVAFALTIAVSALQSALSWGVAAAAIIAGIIAITSAVNEAKNEAQSMTVSTHAKGGAINTMGGHAAIFGENGNPELIHENSRGQVQIDNNESLTGAFLEALRIHETEKQSRGQEVTVNVELQPNGNALARALNPYIRQENVRTSRI